MKRTTFILALFALCIIAVSAKSQDFEEGIVSPGDEEPLYTLFSIKLSGGYGFGRGSQYYGNTGNEQVYWSAGEGAKMDMGLVVPLLPIDVVNLDGEEFGPERFPVVGLDMELASGYHVSTGGTTNDELLGGIMTTNRKYTYIPVTLGFNARATLGAGMPSIFVGAGGGINVHGIYEDQVSFSNSTATFTRKYTPPIPFTMYGVIGFEIPLLYSAEDGNSMVDLFVQGRLEDATNYIYDYRVEGSDGSQVVVRPNDDEFLLNNTESARSASSASISLGFKINIY
ncbi:MAG TPA: hypothetical protein VIX80_08700 [Candidatus Kapabacteria bacterium]